MDSIVVQKEKMIAKSAEAIWQLVEPVENMPKWFPIATRVELLSGTEKGRKQRVFAKWEDHLAEIDMEVIDWVPNRVLRWRHIRELLDGKPAPVLSKEVTLSVQLEPVGGGTKVILASEMVPAGALKGMMIKAVAKPRIAQAMEEALERIARL
jgi:uncharacterized protein YndB with AHSA1/START domain